MKRIITFFLTCMLLTCTAGALDLYEATLAEAMGRGLLPCDKCVQTDAHPNLGPVSAERYTTTVLRVVDGDTIVVNYNGTEEKVRLIGVDTPESVHPDNSKNTDAGFAASEFTNVYLTGEEVELEFDVQQRDQYGRLLAYVYFDGEMFNEKLLRTGYANIATYPPNVKYVENFEQIVRNRDSSVPSGEYYDGYMKAPSIIYRVPETQSGMNDAFLYEDGVVMELDLDIDLEYEYIFLRTNSGIVTLMNVGYLPDFSHLKHGDNVRVGFMYITSMEFNNISMIIITNYAIKI